MNGPEEFAEFRRQAHEDSLLTDSLAGHLEARVLALEEVTAARWPRSILVRWRLARALRASVRGLPGRWADRRTEAVSQDWYAATRRLGGRHRQEGGQR